MPVNHLAHFILDAVESVDLRQVNVNTRGTGDAQYPPAMLLGLLIYTTCAGCTRSTWRQTRPDGPSRPENHAIRRDAVSLPAREPVYFAAGRGI